MSSKKVLKKGSVRFRGSTDESEPLLPISQASLQSTSAPGSSSFQQQQQSTPTSNLTSGLTGGTSTGGVNNASNKILPTSSSKKTEAQRFAKRTTKTSQKLTLFPEGLSTGTIPIEATESDLIDEEDDEVPQLPHVVARTHQKEHQWLRKLERRWLPRVTAYCTANAYKMDALMDHLKSLSMTNKTMPRKFDEVIYTPYYFGATAPPKTETSKIPDLIDLKDAEETGGLSHRSSVSDIGSFFEQNIDAFGRRIPENIPYERLAKTIAPFGELLFFDYGVVVMWGLTEAEEKIILNNLKKFEEDHIDPEDVETEQFSFHYNAIYQPRIYNDIITLRKPSNYMIKITISHAVAQSVKLALFEGLIEDTIDTTKHIPQIMAQEGKIHMSQKAINQKIGELFIMRINVNLVSNVLDTPEIFWSEPALEPLYMALRGYLEISQRVDLLNQRVSVISDLLDMLKEHLNSSHGEQLEWIVIILIAFEIVIGIVTISVDLLSYFRTIEKPE